MSDRTFKLVAFFALAVSWGLVAWAWALNARTHREVAVAVARSRAERDRMHVLLDREHAEAVEIKALLERLLERLDGAEAAGPGRERRGPLGRID
jgi:phosphatidylglycerophosphate synthase